jgi:hypothetical protein
MKYAALTAASFLAMLLTACKKEEKRTMPTGLQYLKLAPTYL